MVDRKIQDALIGELNRLPTREQARVLAFAQALGGHEPLGMSGKEFVSKFAGSLPRENVEDMERAIERECERIDPDAW